MKKKRRNGTRKLISRIWISIVMLMLLAIGLLMFSEKVHKIGIVDNVKKQVILMAEQIQNAIGTNAFVLNTKVNLSAANEKGGVDLDWSTYDSNRKNI